MEPVLTNIGASYQNDGSDLVVANSVGVVMISFRITNLQSADKKTVDLLSLQKYMNFEPTEIQVSQSKIVALASDMTNQLDKEHTSTPPQALLSYNCDASNANS